MMNLFEFAIIGERTTLEAARAQGLAVLCLPD